MKFLNTAFSFLSFSILFLSEVNNTAHASESKANLETPKVFARKILFEELSETYTYPARVSPKINSTVLSDSDGIVKKIFTPLGTPVKFGQRLAAVQHTDPVYQYAQAYIKAPVSGVISSIAVREGTQVTKNQEILSVTDPDKIRITVEIAAIDLNAIRAKTTGTFRVSGSDTGIPVEVTGISPFVNPATGTATCELAVLASKEKLRPGFVGQVEFQANRRKGITVPDHALYYKDNNIFLRTIENNIAKKVAVTIGRKQNGQVEILSGVKENDLIIERSSRLVGDGQKVEIQSGEEKK